MAAAVVIGVVDNEKDKIPLKLKEKRDDFLNLFWNLSDENEVTREKAVVLLIQRLDEEQKQKDTDLCCSLLEYAVERLVRGLSSKNKASRIGFYVALVQILRLFHQVQIEHVFKLVKKFNSSSNSKQESSDTMIGLSLGYGSLIRCGRLTEDLNMLTKLVSELLNVIFQKDYLQELCSTLLIELLQNVDESVFTDDVLPSLKSYLEVGFEECTADLFWIVVTCSQKFPAVINKSFLKKHWKVKSLSQKSAFQSISKILLKSSKTIPRVHPVCIAYLVSLLPTNNMSQFWKVMTTTAFEKQKKEELYLMFELLRKMLPHLTTPEQIREFLFPEFVQTFVLNLVRKHLHLHLVAKQLANGMVEFVSKTEDGKLQLEILKLLLLPPGFVLFDKVTNTRTISSMVPLLKLDAVIGLITFLKNVFLEGEQQGESETHRSAALRQLSHLVHHSSIKQETEIQIGILRFLALHAFYKHKAKSEDIPETNQITPIISSYLHATANESFFHALAGFPTAKSSLSFKNWSSLRHHFTVLYGVLQYVDLLFRNPEVATPLITWSSDARKALDEILKVVENLSERSEKDGCVAELHAFQILFLHLGLRLFSETKRTLEILSDLRVCCHKAMKERRRHSVRKATMKENGTAEEEPEWSQVVVDLLLSLLSENSNWMRAVTQQVFALLVPHLTLSSVNQIVDVLSPKVGADKSTEANEDSELVQFSSGSESEKEEEDEEKEEVDDNETEVVDEETELLRKSVKAALGDAAADSEEELSDLDDNAMMQLDDTLAEAFRSFIKKDRLSQENETLIHFQTRCLDMIEIIISSRPNVNFLLNLIFPLLSTAEYGLKTKNCSSLGQKALNCLQKFSKTKKFEESETNLLADLDFKQILKDLFSKSHKSVDYTNSQLIPTVCTFVVTMTNNSVSKRYEVTYECSVKSTRKKQPRVTKVDGCMEVYKQALKDFFDKGDCHTSSNIFTSLIAKYLNLGWELIDILLNFSFMPDVRLFKKTQAIGMLSSLTASPKNVRKLASVDRWADISNDCILKITKSLEDMVKQPKHNHIAGLCNLAVNVISVDAKFGKETQRPESFIEVVKSLQMVKGWNTNAKRSKNKLCGLLNIKTPKRKNGDADMNPSSSKRKKTKQDVANEF